VKKSYAESLHELERLGFIDHGQAPPSPPSRRPQFDDDALGVEFFRTSVADSDLSNLTLPGTFFGRSEIVHTSFRNSDLSRSTMCWNDFIDVDFSSACLAECDLRAATFEGCRFTNADVSGALLGREQSIALSDEQRRTVVWCDDEPPGG
jgi:BTB/POZ domain-containing protein KCTD9